MNRTRPATERRRQAGVASILAMMFLVIFGALAAAMAIVAQGNLRTATTYQRVNRSLAAAETGLRFAEYRFGLIAATISTDKGQIDQTLAAQIWPILRDAVIDEMGDELHSVEPYTMEGQKIVLGRIPTGSAANAPTFQITLEQHPLAGEDYDSAFYQQAPYSDSGGVNAFTVDGEPVTASNPVAGWWVRVVSVGEDDGIQRRLQMDWRLDKKIRFAILSRSRIMVGRNVIINGTIGSRYTLTEYLHGHPAQICDNFKGLNATLDAWVDALTTYLGDNDVDGDNRILLADARESENLANAETYDRNADGYVDNYDFFLLYYDGADQGGNEDGSLSLAEFTDSGGGLYDEQLWQLVNEAKYPPGTEFDWVGLRVKLAGGEWTDAAADLNAIDNDDDYAKIHGEVILKAGKAAWESGAADGPYQVYFGGTLDPDANEAPLTFDAADDKFGTFAPGDFDVSGYSDLADGDFAGQVASPTANDPAEAATYTPPGSATLESVPYNAAHPYDFYERPVYENMVFTDVTIPKGTNALFKDCKFVGVTFVDTEANNTDANYNYAGMLDENGELKYTGITATVNGEEVADTKTVSNNVRFDSCTFEGVVVSAVPQEFTQARNKIQFTGKTVFDIDAPSLSSEQKVLFHKSTILTPHYSIDMGTFTEPASADEVTQLDGAIVAGVLDIRGQARIDGSIITTYEPSPGQGPLAEGGNPANFNTTIGYFGSAAGDAEAEMPTGGYGKIIIRYDPNRPLPDGITGPIELRGDLSTYHEGNG